MTVEELGLIVGLLGKELDDLLDKADDFVNDFENQTLDCDHCRSCNPDESPYIEDGPNADDMRSEVLSPVHEVLNMSALQDLMKFATKECEVRDREPADLLGALLKEACDD